MTKRRACPFASRAYSWRSNQSINTTSSKPRAVWEIHLGLDTGNKWDSCWAGHIRARGPRSSSVGLVVVYWCVSRSLVISHWSAGPTSRNPSPASGAPRDSRVCERARARAGEEGFLFLFESRNPWRETPRRRATPRRVRVERARARRDATPESVAHAARRWIATVDKAGKL